FLIGNVGRDAGTLLCKGKFESADLITGEAEFSPLGRERPSKHGAFKAVRAKEKRLSARHGTNPLRRRNEAIIPRNRPSQRLIRLGTRDQASRVLQLLVGRLCQMPAVFQRNALTNPTECSNETVDVTDCAKLIDRT